MTDTRPAAELAGALRRWTDETITVLHVDDDRPFRELCAEFLERQEPQLTVHGADSPAEARERVVDEDIDCIVSDYEMPGMDGLEFLEWVRAEQPNLPFVLFTREDVAAAAFDAGATDYLRKSVGTNQYPVLANRIRRSVETYRSGRLRQLFRSAVEHAGHSIYITDTDGVIEYVNPTFEETTGYDAESAIGRTPRILKSGEHGRAFYSNLWETVLDGEVWESELINERKNGEQYVVNQTVAPILDGDGEPQRFVAVNQEITERKQSRIRLRSFKQAIDHSGHAVFITKPDGTITYVNPAFEEITGYNESDVLGRNPRILSAGTQDEEYYSNLWGTIKSGDVWDEQIVNERQDGTQYYADQTIAPLTADNGTVEGFVAIQRDITELKEYEQALESQRDNLEVLNQMVRHDIRNDLQMVIAAAELLDEHVDEEGAEYLEMIRESARSAVDITGTARNLADTLLRDETEYKPVSLSKSLESALDELRSTYKYAEITSDGSLPAVSVRANEMLESVFRNLLKNAIQHNDKDVPEVTVSVVEDGDHVVVHVADNGPGIADTRKDEIFEKGETRLDSDDERGLGLHLVGMLVEEYDGTVRVEDNEPEGSVFSVELPVAERRTPVSM